MRKSMPRYDRVKQKVSDLLTPFQRARLAELIREDRDSPKKSLTPSSGKGQDADGKSVKGDSGAEKNPGKESSDPKPWSFKNDLDPERHVNPKTPDLPKKGGTSKAGDGAGS